MSKTKLLVLACFVIFYCILPGNISWINDEPILIWNALHWNEIGGIAKIGLIGSKAIPFGAVPTIIYQIFLFACANNLIFIVMLKATIFVLTIYFSTHQICKLLKLNEKLAFLPLLSPYVFHYSRILWDNCFLIPSAFLFLLVLLYQLQTPSKLKLSLIFIISTILLQIHLTSLMLIIPSFCFLVWKQRQWLVRNIVFLSGIFLLSFLINYPYLDLVIKELPYSETYNHETNLAYILSGFYYFSGWKFFETFLQEVLSSYLGISCIVATLISLLSLGFYIFCLLINYIATLTKKSDPIMSLMITILIGATIIAYLAKIDSHPHYLSSLTPVYCILIILGMNLILNFRATRIINVLYVASMLALIIIFQLYTYQFEGNKNPNYGATLRSQLRIFSEINSAGQDSLIYTGIANYQYFPHSYQTLLKILPKSKNMNRNETFFVVYANPEGPDGQLALIKKGR